MRSGNSKILRLLLSHPPKKETERKLLTSLLATLDKGFAFEVWDLQTFQTPTSQVPWIALGKEPVEALKEKGAWVFLSLPSLEALQKSSLLKEEAWQLILSQGPLPMTSPEKIGEIQLTEGEATSLLRLKELLQITSLKIIPNG